MRVEFFVADEAKRISSWTADRGKRRIVPGASMGYGRGIPHDLVQYVIEASTGYRHGFWGLVEKGATFASTGRKRTRPGRAVIAAHRGELIESERLAGHHTAAWRAGEQTPVTAALDRATEQWRDLGPADRLVFEWPSPTGTVELVAPSGRC